MNGKPTPKPGKPLYAHQGGDGEALLPATFLLSVALVATACFVVLVFFR